MILGFVILLLLLASLTVYSSQMSYVALRSSIGLDSVSIAERYSLVLDAAVYGASHDLALLAGGPSVVDPLVLSNAEFESMSDPEAYIDSMDENWTSVPEDEVTPFMQSLIENNLSEMLDRRLIEHYAAEHGADMYGEIFVANQYGAVIAMTGRTTDYRQDDEEWWTNTLGEHRYISDVGYDRSCHCYGVIVSVPVYSENGTFQGILRAFVNLTGLVQQMSIEPLRFETARLRVLSRDGLLIYDTHPYGLLTDVSDASWFSHVTGASGYFLAEEGGRDILAAHSCSKGYVEYVGYGWITLVSYDVEEILGPAVQTRALIMEVGLLLVLFGLIGGLAISRSITRPIVAFRAAAEEIGAGNLKRRVEVSTRDEIGELARGFNDMAARMEDMLEHLEEKVSERTTQLNEANRLLSLEVLVRKRAEMELARAMRALARSNEDLQQFANVASHDLQEPLRKTRTYAELLASDYRGRLDEKAERHIDRLVDGTVRMQNLIDDILSYSRVNSVGPPPESRPLGPVLSGVLDTLNPTIQQTGAVVTHDPLPALKVDPLQFAQVFQNLVGNSLKFRGVDPPRIHVGAKESETEWTIWVEDNGIGIDPRHFGKLFKIFATLHPKSEYPGTGMGLAITKKIIERHGGRIWIESEPGRGAKFAFAIPKAGEA